jgi:spermidine synthase
MASPVIPRTLIGRARIPGGGELRLIRRGSEYSIMLGGNELMNSRVTGSEEALATIACERLAGRPHPVLLIGGLGMGFTLRAALAAVGGDAKLEVSELVPAIIDWARGPLADLFGASLDDPRVSILEGDVADRIASARAAYDAILLDVDNGPDGLTRESNDRLYDAAGLRRIAAALRPGGLLGIWSADPAKGFSRRLAAAGLAAEEISVRAHAGRGGARHVIWLATKPGRPR